MLKCKLIFFSSGSRILVRGGGTSDKISYMNSTQVLYCKGVAKISVRGGGTFSKNGLIKDF